MQFTLAGFTHDAEYRAFAFDSSGEKSQRIRFTVRVDVALSRKHGIRLQELPSMCLAIVQRNGETHDVLMDTSSADRTLNFTEEAMMQHSQECESARAAIVLKRSKSRSSALKPSEATEGFSLTPTAHPLPAPAYRRD